MCYSEFSLELVERRFGLTTREGDLFPNLAAVAVPSWLPDMLSRGTRLALISEKARSEFIVAPILLAAREISGDKLAIFSGQRLDVDPEFGLVGECDFILAVSPAVPPLHAPIVMVVEAKKNDIELGLGQCAAQMVAALKFNTADGREEYPSFGCVTSGENWQFLRLIDNGLVLHQRRYYLDNVGLILGAMLSICREADRCGIPVG